MKRTSVALVALASVILVCMTAYRLNTPEKQVDRFVERNSAQLAELLDADKPLPAELEEGHHRRDGEHPMDEFIVVTIGSTYYGCYYSPDDVPLAFQNSGLELVDDVRGGWSWRAEGDNYGYTEQLAPCWYYFEAKL